MPLTFNIRHLDKHDLHLKGQLPAAELDVETGDDIIQVNQPLEYDLEIQKVEDAALAQGHLRLPLDCLCVRCLKPVAYFIDLRDWAAHLPLKGEEKVTMTNDIVDLTPFVREDILLAFPQHPLCKPDCGGLPSKPSKGRKTSDKANRKGDLSPWTELDKLKF